MRVPSIRLAAVAVFAVAAGCSSAPAQQPTQSEAMTKPEPGELFRCLARQAYYKEMEAGIYPKTLVSAGKLVFHAVTPDERWLSGAELKFTSLRTTRPSGTATASRRSSVWASPTSSKSI